MQTQKTMHYLARYKSTKRHSQVIDSNTTARNNQISKRKCNAFSHPAFAIEGINKVMDSRCLKAISKPAALFVR